MKDKKEILFNKLEPSAEGGLKITTDSILQAMEEYSDEKIEEFMLQYLGRGGSRFEVKRMIDIFNENEPF